MIEIKNITKQYGDRVILADLSTQIRKGKITALIGANGAGKSSLLNIISRLTKQDKGAVLLEGSDIQHYKNKILAQKLSILKQSNYLDIKISIRDLVNFGRFPYTEGKLKAADIAQVDQALQYLDLVDIQEHYIDQVSGGQRQRAFLAMLVAQDTEYILLDEPLNNLDMLHSSRIMCTLRRLCDELQKTIIVVLHDINFAAKYTDDIIALKAHKIAYHDRKENIINPQILEDIFGFPIQVLQVENQTICNYY